MPVLAPSKNFLWVLTREPIADWSIFVNAWSRLYLYPDLDEYTRLIAKNQLTTNDIEWLFSWKNGMNLSQAKQLRVANDILPEEQLLNQLRENFSLITFEEHFSDLSAIWQVFLLHILQPATFPIFDQHVYRAYQYLNMGQTGELLIGKAKRMSLYHKNYLPFFNQIVAATTANRQTIDQALWAFGKFIKQYPAFIKHD